MTENTGDNNMIDEKNIVVDSKREQEEDGIREVIDAIVRHVRADHYEEFKKLIHNDILSKYDDEYIKAIPFYNEEDAMHVFSSFKYGAFYIEDDKALVMKKGLNLIQVFKKEEGEWKWCGRKKREVKMPEAAQGFKVDDDAMNTYAPVIQDKLKSVVAFCKEVFILFEECNYMQLQQNILMEYQGKNPLVFKDIPVVKLYINNIDREKNRPIKCIHLNDIDDCEPNKNAPEQNEEWCRSGLEAVVSFEGFPVLWYLVKFHDKWAIRRVIDMSNPEFTVSGIPPFYFNRK